MHAFKSKGYRLFGAQTLRRIASAVCCALVFAMIAPTLSLAQGTRGTISGVVTDQAGAVVSGASVKLVNIATQAEVRTVQTNTEGIYQFLEVEPANYNIVITMSGFAEARLNEVKVEPNRNVQLDVTLGATGTTEEVTVTASSELVERQSAALGTTVEQRRVEGLPLNGRNVLDLTLLQPGVIANNTNPLGAAPFGNGLGIRINGARGVENNLTLDGSNNNEIAVGGALGSTPRPDAVQEFRLLTSNYEAEYGRNAGSIINVVTRSGTNDLHGNVRMFYRPTFLSAARFFDQDSPSDRALSGPGDFRRRFERKEIGGNIGGPVWIPKIYNGKEKTFFFADYETRRQLVGDTRTLTGLPTAAELGGDFSLTGRTITDPATGQPFPGNRIPESRISPIARYYLQFFPVTDATGTASVGADQINDNDWFTARVDHLINNRQAFNFTFNFFDTSVIEPFAFGGASVPGFGSVDERRTFNYVARHTYTLSPTVINSFLASYSRNNQPSTAPINQTSPADIGFTANFVANQQFAGPPRITLSNRAIILGNTIQGPQARVTENFQLQDAVSWARGDHRFKFGFDGTYYKQDQTFLFVNQGILNFNRNSGLNTTGDDFADFLIGTSPSSVQFGANGLRDFRQHQWALFAQDAWRVNDELTLSLGLRYEFISPITDKFNRVAYYREGAVSELLTSGQLRAFEGTPIIVPEGRRAPVGVVFVGDPDPVLGGTVPAGGVEKDWNNFAPRIGVAWSPGEKGGLIGNLLGDRKSVIRAGFGLYYGAIIGDTALQQLNAPGFNGTNTFLSPASGTLADPFAPDPFPNYRGNSGQLQNPFTQSQTAVFAPVNSFSRSVDPFIRTPYTLQYNLTIERAFLNDYVASVSYVGSRGYKLYNQRQLNPALGTFFEVPDGRTIPTPTPANANLRRLNPDIPSGVVQMESTGNSWYNALQANLQKRYRNGLVLQVAYTFSRLISDSDTNRDAVDVLFADAVRGLAPQDAPHRLVASWIYDLPFFRESRGFAGRVLGGWSLGGIATFQSGTPFSVNNPFDTTGTGGAVVSFADLGAPFQTFDPRTSGGRAFNPDAFVAFGAPTATGGYSVIRRGTAGYNQYRLPNGINNFDLILSKKTRLWSETTGLELRFEAFNAFNHTQFTTVDTNLLNIVRDAQGNIDLNRSSFGKFTGTRESRVIQLGARFTF
jgi:hypothetical protein